MLYAQVVLGLAVRGPFDYIVPADLSRRIKPGARVWVDFHYQKMVGFVVGITRKTSVLGLKPILSLIDEYPILDKPMLSLTRALSDYYCCSWGEAVCTALPDKIRQGKPLPPAEPPLAKRPMVIGDTNNDTVLVHDLDGQARWDTYIKRLSETLASNRSAILLLPDADSVSRAQKIIGQSLKCSLGLWQRKQTQELQIWSGIRKGDFNVVIGSRSAVFAPLDNPGLIIIEEEHNSAYKQDQVPHYHARQVAMMRAQIQKAGLILGSGSPALESLYLARQKKIKYVFMPRQGPFPEVKVVDRKSGSSRLNKDSILTGYLYDAINQSLARKEKILLFLDRRGFATLASCKNCRQAIKCPRCNINLVYHFEGKLLNCHYCNFKLPAPDICPNCNAGYIRYSGSGTEKLESELSRLFPQAVIGKLDDKKAPDRGQNADISVSGAAAIAKTDLRFNLVGVVSIDNCLNRIDFRSGEKAFALLSGLLGLVEEKLVIQTYLPGHPAFKALLNRDINIFYDEELKQRKDLGLPPYKHLGLVKLRGREESKVKEASHFVFEELAKPGQANAIKLISVNPGQPSKLRGKFFWQILLKSSSATSMSRFLKTYLKNIRHSGIIVTTDIDPL